MTASDHRYETSGDRASLAREAGVGKLSLISVLAGTLVAYGSAPLPPPGRSSDERDEDRQGRSERDRSGGGRASRVD
jgi:hypothetical protein